MLSIPSGSETATEGLSDDKPIVLEDVKSLDFERMMWMFYNEFVAPAPYLHRSPAHGSGATDIIRTT
jgi:hypothetical protein